MTRTKFENKEYSQITVGMGATGSYWTDCYPYEVVRIISDKTIEIRRLDSEMVEGTDWLDQEYNLFSNDTNPIERARKCKTGWRTSGGMKISLGYAREYRDPSF